MFSKLTISEQILKLVPQLVTVLLHFVQVVLSALLSVALAAPQSGPLTPLVGNLVATPRGYADINLEGFSEDLDQDGFVDPVVPAAPVSPVIYHTAPVVQAAHAVYNTAPVFYNTAPYYLNAGYPYVL